MPPTTYINIDNISRTGQLTGTTNARHTRKAATHNTTNSPYVQPFDVAMKEEVQSKTAASAGRTRASTI
eukprot:15627-Eustigmatos_ZCMA.PRE.1